ncbi:hypothetical protein [Phytohabitans rumicis]|uniref:Uncharacterized protein n=1 Tax=Phytohabitans rumicis TaxID=1076125 RepID=A0A6V8LCW7_9ACTN|nr:hypothetical protein [Phytohabitans rumicis]GFJ90515.1 hypothetical protein Prum_041570 [Phytohabitans rumicis]
MYAWIWRHLPFRKWPYKLATSLVLIVGIGALLWYVVFPWAEPLLPFDDVQVEQDSGVPASPSPDAGDEHDIPYETEPSATPSR